MEDTPDWVEPLHRHAEAFFPNWVNMRRHLHRNPEVSGAEIQTTEYLRAALRKLELPVHVAGEARGVSADLVMAGTDGRIAVRGDIDALPITDAKNVEYRSQSDGVMHACGHDVHATVVFGAMQVLREMQRQQQLPWPIAVRAILQPAEEICRGARHMIHHHALRDVQAIVAMHVDPTRSVGCVGLRQGVLCAAADMVQVEIRGQGGHGARPHLTRDPIEAGTAWIQSAFRRVSRTADPRATVVFSVGEIQAGHSPNVIPDTAVVRGSLRSLDLESRRVALETLEDVCESVRRESGCEVEMSLGVSAPAVVNDKRLVSLLNGAVEQGLSAGAVEWIDEPSMGSEDFSYYLEHIPGAMFRLGVAGDQIGRSPLHTSLFDIDERALSVGVKVLVAAVINYFDPQTAGQPSEPNERSVRSA